MKNLQRTLRFNENDIRLNREGRLSKKQISRIKNERQFVFLSALGFGVLMVIAALVLWTRAPIISLLVGIFGLVLIIGESRLSRVAVDDLPVQHMRSKITLDEEPDEDEEDVVEYLVIAGDTEFSVTYPQYESFEDGQVYDLYFVHIEHHDNLGKIDVPPMLVAAVEAG